MKKLMFATLAIFVMLALAGCKEDDPPPVNNPVPTGISVTPIETSVRIGETEQFTAVVNGSHGPVQTVTWSLKQNDITLANNSTIATISQTGLLEVKDGAIVDSEIVVVATSTVYTSLPPGTVTVTVAQKHISSNAVLNSIAVTNPPAKTEYIVDDVLDLTGIRVDGTYKEDGQPDVTAQIPLSDLDFNPMLLNTVGETIVITVSHRTLTTITTTFNVKVNLKPSVPSDFHVINNSQNARSVTDVIVTAADGKTDGTISVLYGDSKSTTVPKIAGTYKLFVNVTATATYAEVTELELTQTLVIASVHLVTTDFSYTPFNEVLLADVGSTTLTVNWAASEEWNTGVILTVSYRANVGGTETSAIPATNGWYFADVKVAANAGFFDAVTIELFNFEVVTTPVIRGDADVTINFTQFDDKSPNEIAGGEVSRTGLNGDKTKTITVTATFTTIEWYVNGVKESNSTGSFLFDQAGRALGGPYYVTARIQVGGTWYSTTVVFTVNP